MGFLRLERKVSLNNRKRRIASIIIAAAVAFIAAVLPDTGIKSLFVVEAGAEGKIVGASALPVFEYDDYSLYPESKMYILQSDIDTNRN